MSSEDLKPITGIVLRIVDEFTVIIDVGYKKGVTSGMKFVIYIEGEEIYAPDGKKLGKIEHPKAKVVVTHVQENFSIAKSSEFKSAQAAAMIAKALTEYPLRKELPVDSRNIMKLEPVDMKVNVGDKVRQIEPM